MAHTEDRWTAPTGKVDTRGRPIRERTDRYGSGLRWVALWTEGASRKSKSFPNKDAADDYLRQIGAAKRDGTHVGANKLTVADFGDQWIEQQIHQRGSTYKQMESRYRIHIRPTLGHMLLSEVTEDHIQSAVVKWQRDLAPATVAVIYGYVTSILAAAVRRRVLARSPLNGKKAVNLPRDIKERVVPLTTEQVLTIADRINPRYRSLVLLGAATGLRSGELRGLTTNRLIWGDVLTVRVDRQLLNNTPKWGPPKTARSDRAVTVDDVTAGMLQYHILRWPPLPSGLIFTGTTNGPLNSTSIGGAWRAAIKGMGLPERSGLHQLRHYHASLLIAAGVSVTAVADRLGHEDSSVTLRTYAHLWANDEERARGAITTGLWSGRP